MRPVLILPAIALIWGCAGPAPNAAAPDSLVLEFVSFPDCPNTPALRRSLQAALQSTGRGLTIRDVNQDSLPPTDPRRRWPSPTVLVDGADLFGMPAPESPEPGCRIYSGGVPDAPAIAARLRALSRR